MSKKKITVVLILDASSSMRNKQNEVSDGIVDIMKDAIKMSKENEDTDYDALVTQFSSPGHFKVVYQGPITESLDFDEIRNGYQAHGMTALYDAVVTTFGMIPKERDGVFINIFTDGEENSSQEAKLEDVKKLIEAAKKNLWGVTFMGTTEEEIGRAVAMGLSRGSTMSYHNSRVGTQVANSARSKSFATYSNMVSNNSVSADALDNLMEESKTGV